MHHIEQCALGCISLIYLVAAFPPLDFKKISSAVHRLAINGMAAVKSIGPVRLRFLLLALLNLVLAVLAS